MWSSSSPPEMLWLPFEADRGEDGTAFERLVRGRAGESKQQDGERAAKTSST